MKQLILLSLYTSLWCAVHGGSDTTGHGQTNEGNEFYVGFFQNRFGVIGEFERIPPVIWVTTRESTPVHFNVSTIAGIFFSGVANPGQVTYVPTTLALIVFKSAPANSAERYKGIRIKAQENRKIVVYGQHEELASNDGYLALPVLPQGRPHEYIVASVNSGAADDHVDSVALIVGTENDTKLTVIPTQAILTIPYPLATLTAFFAGLSDDLNTITIGQYETVYLQIRQRPGDISGTRIIADKPVSVFSGHECANVPSDSRPCDMLIEQIPPIDTWGTRVVTIPLRTRPDGDVVKVIATQDSTTVNVTRTDIDTGVVTADPSFILDSNEYREFLIKDYSLIQSDHPIGVFQFSRSWLVDSVKLSDPFMMYVPPTQQYHHSYVVATAPFDPSLEGTAIPFRGPYVNYTNIAIPKEYFDVSQLTVNNGTLTAADFKPIRNADNSIWGYGAQLLLDEGAQVISHSDEKASFGVTLYGFSNQMSWGYTGGVGLDPIQNICEVGEISGSVRYRRRTRIATLTFSVAGKSATATTECRLDREDFRSCTSPATFSNITSGRHTVTVRAICPDDGDVDMVRVRFRARR